MFIQLFAYYHSPSPENVLNCACFVYCFLCSVNIFLKNKSGYQYRGYTTLLLNQLDVAFVSVRERGREKNKVLIGLCMFSYLKIEVSGLLGVIFSKSDNHSADLVTLGVAWPTSQSMLNLLVTS